MEKFKTTKDIFIPKGTEFTSYSGNVDYVSGNYEALLEDGKDGTIRIFICDEGELYKEAEKKLIEQE